MPIDRQATLDRLNAYCAAFNLTPPPVDFDGEGDGNDALFAMCDWEGISLDWLFRGEGEAKPGLMACARAALDRMTDDELSRAYSALLEQQREGGCPVTTPRRSGLG